MLSTVCLLVVLLGVFSVSADFLLLGNQKGLTVMVSPNSISVSRQLSPQTSMPPPPTTIQPPPTTTTTPPSPTSSSSMPTNSPTVTATNSPPPSPPSTPMPQTSPPPVFTGVITLSVASIRELDGNMTQVTSPPNIVSGPIGNGAITPATPVSNIVGSNPVVQVTCQTIVNPLTSVSNASTLVISLCGILNNGTVFYGTESANVTQGQLGLSMQIKSWPWTATGSYLEVKVSMSVMSGRRMSLTTGVPVVLGLGTTDSFAMLSTRVITDATTFNTMPTGYPMLTQSDPVDNKASIIAILPRSNVGTGTITWESIIEPGYQANSPGPVSAAGSVVASWMIHTITAALACLVGSFDRRH